MRLLKVLINNLRITLKLYLYTTKAMAYQIYLKDLVAHLKRWKQHCIYRGPCKLLF